MDGARNRSRLDFGTDLASLAAELSAGARTAGNGSFNGIIR